MTPWGIVPTILLCIIVTLKHLWIYILEAQVTHVNLPTTKHGETGSFKGQTMSQISGWHGQPGSTLPPMGGTRGWNAKLHCNAFFSVKGVIVKS